MAGPSCSLEWATCLPPASLRSTSTSFPRGSTLSKPGIIAFMCLGGHDYCSLAEEGLQGDHVQSRVAWRRSPGAFGWARRVQSSRGRRGRSAQAPLPVPPSAFLRPCQHKQLHVRSGLHHTAHPRRIAARLNPYSAPVVQQEPGKIRPAAVRAHLEAHPVQRPPHAGPG